MPGAGSVPIPGRKPRTLLAETKWGPADYRRFVARLRQDQHVYEGEAGFPPCTEGRGARCCRAPGLFDAVE
ncbi:MAG: hypothetical protein U0792_07735 [Gemmataceae bacterium]